MVIMNKILLLLAILLMCKTISFAQGEKTFTLVFMDKSNSSTIDEQSKKDFNTKVSNLLSNRYKANGSIIQVKYLHKGTQGDYTTIKHQFSEKLQSCEDCGSIERELVNAQNKKLISEAQKNIRLKLVAYYTEKNPNSSSQFTDIWSSLEWISRVFNDVHSKDKLVIYSSDMVESMQGTGRRDFHKNPLKSKNDAIDTAKKDLIWIKSNLSINASAFKNLKITIWPPANTLQGSSSPNMIYYWETLFTSLGAQFTWG